VIINNRLESHEGQVPSIALPNPSLCSGDFVTPERNVPPRPIRNLAGELLPWESCITMNDNWGFNATDRNFKPARLLLRKLVECVSKGGNMLLNVGPDPRGRIPDDSLVILDEIGRWMALNQASITGCGVADVPKPDWGWFTQQGNHLYAHLFEPSLGAHALPVPADRIARVRLLASGAELKTYAPWNASDQAYGGHAFVTLGLDLPYFEQVQCRLPDETDTVLDIELKPADSGR
jgi:alpha-L-fucosidase